MKAFKYNLLDTLFLRDCKGWAIPIIVGVFELIIILILGEKLGVNFLRLLIHRILETFKKP